MEAKSVRQIFFTLAFFAGLSLLFFGAVSVVVQPYFKLDAVLTPEQLHDHELRQRTLGRLKQDQTVEVLPCIAGLVLIAVGAFGHYNGRIILAPKILVRSL